MLLLEVDELFVPTVPVDRLADLPYEPDPVELGFLILVYLARLALLLQLELPPLLEDPFAEPGVLRVRPRDLDVAVLGLVAQERLVVALPDLLAAAPPQALIL